MAEPRPAAASAPRIEGGRFLVVEARYYDTIGAVSSWARPARSPPPGRPMTWSASPGRSRFRSAWRSPSTRPKAGGRPYDGAVALGCVIRGETFHFEIVAGESARALMDMSVQRKLPLGNGILTTETIEQAEERADPNRGDKGGEAARAAIGLALLERRLGR